MPHTPLRIALARPWPGTRRGMCLWLFSIAFVIIGGVNYVTTTPPAVTRQSLSFALDIAPAPVWGWLMVVVGAAATWSSYCHFGRDRYGFMLLATFCAGWGLGYLCGFAFYDAGLRAVSGSVIWLLFSAVLMLLAGFPNVTLGKPPPLIHDQDKGRNQ